MSRIMVAYTMFVSEDDPEYDVYCDAYGLEMNIDDELEVDTVLLAPCSVADHITDSTEVTSMGTVYAGSCGPFAPGATPSKLSWHLIDLREFPSPETRSAEVAASAEHRSGILLRLSDLNQLENLALPEATEVVLIAPNAEPATLAATRENFSKQFGQTTCRILAPGVEGNVYPSSAIRAVGADGIFVETGGYAEMLDIINAAAN